ncbi:MAG: hypothetical protein ABI700_19475 [Chloroflexota bacterium]
MKIITEDALVVCAHELGKVNLKKLQDYVTINGHKMLVDNDPEQCSIASCPNIGVSIKPCQHTLKVDTGYSTFIRIDGHRLCLDTVVGKTDGTPPGVVIYHVRQPGQDFVGGSA